MHALISNNKGFTIIEMLVAILLTVIGIVGLLSMQPQGWALSSRSDALGRANQMLHEQFELTELHVMNACNANSPWGSALPGNGATIQDTSTISSSGGNAAGDYRFTVVSRITGTGTNTWRIRLQITWPGNATGISESRDVTRQNSFRQGC